MDPRSNVLPAAHEADRLRAVARYDQPDLAGDAAFEHLVSLAAQVCETPIATLTIVDDTRQHFRVRTGLAVESAPREHAFCVHTMALGDLMMVTDAQADARFADNPLVTGPLHVRAYAGVPLVTEDGYALGTLCVVDTEPHALSDEQQQLLRMLARQAMTQLELRRATRDADDLRRQLAETTLERRRILDLSVDVLCVLDAEGRFVEASQAVAEWWGRPPEDVIGRNWRELVHPDDQVRALQYVRTVRRGNGRAVDLEVRCLHRDGRPVPMHWSSRWSADVRRAYCVARAIAAAAGAVPPPALPAGIAHELANMLAPIVMAVDVLRDAVTGPDARDVLASIETSAVKGSALIEQLQAFVPASQGERGTTDGAGTRFAPPSTPAAPLAARRRRRGAGQLILVIDDEQAVRVVTQRVLEVFGYRVLVAAEGVEGTALFGQRRDEIAVVVTDMMMPGLDGEGTIRALRRLDPDVRVIAASGLAAGGMQALAAAAGAQHFLAKPYTADALLDALDAVLHGHQRSGMVQ